MKAAIDEVEFEDVIRSDIRKKYNLETYAKAIKNIHFPENEEQLKKARERLVFEEFFRFILAVRSMKRENSGVRTGRDYGKCKMTNAFEAALP